jgi:hypothetical protein
VHHTWRASHYWILLRTLFQARKNMSPVLSGLVQSNERYISIDATRAQRKGFHVDGMLFMYPNQSGCG